MANKEAYMYSILCLQCYNCPIPVRYQADCNTTTTCAPNNQCMRRQLVAKDGHIEYTMACENTKCSMLTSGLGKRDMTDVTGLNEFERDRYERDVTLKCCDTDLCNNDARPTVTSTTPRHSTPSSACLRDVVFIMHDQYTTNHANQSAALWVDFLEQVVANMSVGPGQARVAAVTFGHGVLFEWYLDRYSSKPELQAAIESLRTPILRFQPGVTDPGYALKYVSDFAFNPSTGDRASAGNVVVLLEHGLVNNRNAANEAVKIQAATDDFILIAVGAGNVPLHIGISSDVDHTFDVDTYQDLTSIVPQMVNFICF